MLRDSISESFEDEKKKERKKEGEDHHLCYGVFVSLKRVCVDSWEKGPPSL